MWPVLLMMSEKFSFCPERSLLCFCHSAKLTRITSELFLFWGRKGHVVLAFWYWPKLYFTYREKMCNFSVVDRIIKAIYLSFPLHPQAPQVFFVGWLFSKSSLPWMEVLITPVIRENQIHISQGPQLGPAGYLSSLVVCAWHMLTVPC